MEKQQNEFSIGFELWWEIVSEMVQLIINTLHYFQHDSQRDISG